MGAIMDPRNSVTYCWYVSILARQANVTITGLAPMNMGVTVKGSPANQAKFNELIGPNGDVLSAIGEALYGKQEN